MRSTLICRKDTTSEQQTDLVCCFFNVCRKLGVGVPVLSTITARELLDRDFPPLVELIEGMLAPGLYILAGAPKIGKSWLVLQIAHHVSTGTSLWDRRVSRHPVLYLSLEDTLPRIQRRLLTLCDGETGDVAFATEANLLGDGFEKQLAAYLRSHPDTKVVIVDTLAKVRGVVSSANVYSSDYAAIWQKTKKKKFRKQGVFGTFSGDKRGRNAVVCLKDFQR